MSDVHVAATTRKEEESNPRLLHRTVFKTAAPPRSYTFHLMGGCGDSLRTPTSVPTPAHM